MADTFEAPGLHHESGSGHHEPEAKLDPKSAKKLAHGHKEEIILAVIGIVVAIYFYMRSSSGSSAATTTVPTSGSPTPTGSGTGSGGGSSGPGTGSNGYGSQNNTLLQEILANMQSGGTTPATNNYITNNYPSTGSGGGGSTTTTTPTTQSYGTSSPYTAQQITQNSPGPSELSVQAQNNAAWAKAYAANPAGNPVAKTVTYPVSKYTPPKTTAPASGGSSYHQATPISVYHGGSGFGAPVQTVTKSAAKPVTTSRISVGHNYLRP